MGITLLVCLTARPASEALEVAESLLEVRTAQFSTISTTYK